MQQSVREICVLHVFLWIVPSSCDADSLFHFKFGHVPTDGVHVLCNESHCPWNYSIVRSYTPNWHSPFIQLT